MAEKATPIAIKHSSLARLHMVVALLRRVEYTDERLLSRRMVALDLGVLPSSEVPILAQH